VVVFLGNVTVLLIGLPLLTAKVDLLSALDRWFKCIDEVLHRIGRLL